MRSIKEKKSQKADETMMKFTYVVNTTPNKPTTHRSKLRRWTVEEQTCAVQLVSGFRPCLTVVVVRSRSILNSLLYTTTDPSHPSNNSRNCC